MFYYQLPPIIWSMFEDNEIAECNRINRSIHHETNKEIIQRRAKKADFIMNLFYIPSYSLFTTEKSLRHDLEQHARTIFRLIPELLVFLHEHDIHHIDFSMIYSQAKKTYVRIMSDSEMEENIRIIFDYVKLHPNIQYFQYSLFSPILTIEMVEDLIKHHSTLTICAMRRRQFKPTTVLYASQASQKLKRIQ